MNATFLNILRLTSFGVFLSCATEAAHSDNKVLCVNENWQIKPNCGWGIAGGHKVDKKWGVRWIEGKTCEDIGALKTDETEYSRNDIVLLPECEVVL